MDEDEEDEEEDDAFIADPDPFAADPHWNY